MEGQAATKAATKTTVMTIYRYAILPEIFKWKNSVISSLMFFQFLEQANMGQIQSGVSLRQYPRSLINLQTDITTDSSLLRTGQVLWNVFQNICIKIQKIQTFRKTSIELLTATLTSDKYY